MLALAAQAMPMHAAEDEIVVPSGLAISFHDFIRDTLDGGLTYRFRFLAPSLAVAEPDFVSVQDDMAHLCDTYALPRISEIGPQPGRIVVTLMAEPVEFGVATPDVVQYFESYSVSEGLCIWEAF